MDIKPDAFSRTDGVAANLASSAKDAHRFQDKVVLITGEASVLNTPNGRWCLLDSIRMIVRVCRQVYLYVPPECGALRDEAMALAEEIQFAFPVQHCAAAPDDRGFDAVLNIGFQVHPGRPWTAISSNGWVAWASTVGPLPPEASPTKDNPVAALFAASMGVTEVFKRLLQVYPERGPMLDKLAFSLMTLEVGDTDPGPSLPSRLDLPPTWLVGLGAIGNGVALLFSQLPLFGTVWCVDKQRFGDENQNTSVLLNASGIGEWKADWISARIARPDQLISHPLHDEIDSIRKKIGDALPHPHFMLAGLDNIEARWDAQSVWPTCLIDGATGEVEAQAAKFVWGQPGACVKCLFPKPPGVAADVSSAALTGLSVQRINENGAVVSEQDIESAPADKQEVLREHLGKAVCSLVSKVRAQALTAQEVTISPSAPFVSCASAALMVAALVKQLSNTAEPRGVRYYFDLLQGPAAGIRFNTHAEPKCDCHRRASAIGEWRKMVSQDHQTA